MSLIGEARQGVFWTFLKQFSVQSINFVVQIILARILAPSDFGLIAMIMVFIAIGQSLMDSGMTSSLIRVRHISNADYGTVFISNVFVSCVIYLLIYTISPWIADFYNQPVLTKLIRVFSITFVISSFNAVQLAKFTRELNFKKQFTYQFPSVLIGAIIGLYFAYTGFGVWSLVYLNLAQSISFVLITWVFSNWKPPLYFNKKNFHRHFTYGYKLTISSLIDTIYQNIYRILIGKYFNVTSVGYFSQADNLRLFPINQMSMVLDKVTLPLFSKITDDTKLKQAFQFSMKLVLVISAGMMIVLILIADPLFSLILGEKWMPAVPYFQILCIASIMRPIGSYNLNILKVKGRSDLFLKIEIIKKIIGIAAIVISIPFGIEALVWGLCITNVFFAYFNGAFSGKFIDYRIPEQIKDTFPILFFASLPVLLCIYLGQLIGNPLLNIVIISSIYIIQYLILLFLFNNSLLSSLKFLIKK